MGLSKSTLALNSRDSFMRPTPLFLTIMTWASRLLALILFFFWGAFFLEHMKEWFLNPKSGSPPLFVWLLQLVHFLLLVGLLLLLRWEIPGALLTIGSAAAFFLPLALDAGLSGRRYLSLLLFLAITIIPALLALATVYLREHQEVPEG